MYVVNTNLIAQDNKTYLRQYVKYGIFAKSEYCSNILFNQKPSSKLQPCLNQ